MSKAQTHLCEYMLGLAKRGERDRAEPHAYMDLGLAAAMAATEPTRTDAERAGVEWFMGRLAELQRTMKSARR